MAHKVKHSRRDFLRLSTLAVAGAALGLGKNEIPQVETEPPAEPEKVIVEHAIAVVPWWPTGTYSSQFLVWEGKNVG